MTWGDYIDDKMEAVAEKVTKEVAESTRRQSIYELLEDLGELTEKIKNRIDSVSDEITLKKWLKLAAKANSIQEFEEKM